MGGKNPDRFFGVIRHPDEIASDFFFLKQPGPSINSFIQLLYPDGNQYKNQVHDPDKYGASGLCASPRSPVTRGTTSQ